MKERTLRMAGIYLDFLYARYLGRLAGGIDASEERMCVICGNDVGQDRIAGYIRQDRGTGLKLYAICTWCEKEVACGQQFFRRVIRCE
jgi:hypothetical protein